VGLGHPLRNHRRNLCAVALFLMASACTPAEESEETRRYRFLLQQVCVAYDDLRGRGRLRSDRPGAEPGPVAAGRSEMQFNMKSFFHPPGRSLYACDSIRGVRCRSVSV
jgi:hypothetical protein